QPGGGAEPETFRGLLLTLRGRTRLTQEQLAARLSVSARTIQYWETGVSYPAGANLKRLIEVYLEHDALARGGEADAARALWDAASLGTPRLSAFDATWFESLLGRRTRDRSLARRQDWGEAPERGALYGRSAELEQLRHWVVDDHSRLIVLLGMGGMG